MSYTSYADSPSMINLIIHRRYLLESSNSTMNNIKSFYINTVYVANWFASSSNVDLKRMLFTCPIAGSRPDASSSNVDLKKIVFTCPRAGSRQAGYNVN